MFDIDQFTTCKFTANTNVHHLTMSVNTMYGAVPETSGRRLTHFTIKIPYLTIISTHMKQKDQILLMYINNLSLNSPEMWEIMTFVRCGRVHCKKMLRTQVSPLRVGDVHLQTISQWGRRSCTNYFTIWQRAEGVNASGRI